MDKVEKKNYIPLSRTIIVFVFMIKGIVISSSMEQSVYSWFTGLLQLLFFSIVLKEAKLLILSIVSSLCGSSEESEEASFFVFSQ